MLVDKIEDTAGFKPFDSLTRCSFDICVEPGTKEAGSKIDTVAAVTLNLLWGIDKAGRLLLKTSLSWSFDAG